MPEYRSASHTAGLVTGLRGAGLGPNSVAKARLMAAITRSDMCGDHRDHRRCRIAENRAGGNGWPSVADDDGSRRFSPPSMESEGYGTQRAAPAAQKEVEAASPPLRQDPSRS